MEVSLPDHAVTPTYVCSKPKYPPIKSSAPEIPGCATYTKANNQTTAFQVSKIYSSSMQKASESSINLIQIDWFFKINLLYIILFYIHLIYNLYI